MDADSSGSSSSGSISACHRNIRAFATSSGCLSASKDNPISHLCLIVASSNTGVDAYAEEQAH